MKSVEFLGNFFPLLQIDWWFSNSVLFSALCMAPVVWLLHFSQVNHGGIISAHKSMISMWDCGIPTGACVRLSAAPSGYSKLGSWAITQTLILTPSPWECGTDFWPLSSFWTERISSGEAKSSAAVQVHNPLHFDICTHRNCSQTGSCHPNWDLVISDLREQERFLHKEKVLCPDVHSCFQSDHSSWCSSCRCPLWAGSLSWSLVSGFPLCAQVQMSAPTWYTGTAVPFPTLIASPWLPHTGMAVLAKLLPLNACVHYLPTQVHP